MKNADMTTVQLKKSVVKELKSIKKYRRQTYEEIIEWLISIAKGFPERKQNGQYDEFIHRIQQAKMKELWDNKEDEAWENA